MNSGTCSVCRLYSRPDNPGEVGLGVWCSMSVGHGNDGKPIHFSAWCKEQLGWLKPTIIDPREKQKLVLSPVQTSENECFKVLLRPDGSEYLLLENRLKKNFDRDLPAEGLLIWRVVDGRPLLEESHGIGGNEGTRRFLGSVPYPSYRIEPSHRRPRQAVARSKAALASAYHRHSAPRDTAELRFRLVLSISDSGQPQATPAALPGCNIKSLTQYPHPLVLRFRVGIECTGDDEIILGACTCHVEDCAVLRRRRPAFRDHGGFFVSTW